MSWVYLARSLSVGKPRLTALLLPGKQAPKKIPSQRSPSMCSQLLLHRNVSLNPQTRGIRALAQGELQNFKRSEIKFSSFGYTEQKLSEKHIFSLQRAVVSISVFMFLSVWDWVFFRKHE